MTKRLETDKKASFERFKDQHAIRLIMSMIPAGERPDVLDTLLREAHDQGFSAGTSDASRHSQDGASAACLSLKPSTLAFSPATTTRR